MVKHCLNRSGTWTGSRLVRMGWSHGSHCRMPALRGPAGLRHCRISFAFLNAKKSLHEFWVVVGFTPVSSANTIFMERSVQLLLSCHFIQTITFTQNLKAQVNYGTYRSQSWRFTSLCWRLHSSNSYGHIRTGINLTPQHQKKANISYWGVGTVLW